MNEIADIENDEIDDEDNHLEPKPRSEADRTKALTIKRKLDEILERRRMREELDEDF